MATESSASVTLMQPLLTWIAQRASSVGLTVRAQLGKEEPGERELKGRPREERVQPGGPIRLREPISCWLAAADRCCLCEQVNVVSANN